MYTVDNSTGHSPSHQALINLAVDVGVDPSDAVDVLGAVLSFCSERHGTTELSTGYLQFLTVRSACSAYGLPFTRDAVARFVKTAHPREHLFMMALVHARDAAALFDVYRRGILYPVTTNLSASGQALHLDLRRITSSPAEDHPLAWRPALKQMAEWITYWRQGNRSLQLVLVQESGRRLTPSDELRGWLVDWVRREEERCSMSAVTFYWDGGRDTE